MKNLQLIPPFFNVPKIGSIPILLQEATHSFLTQELFGANVISRKNKSPNDKKDISEPIRICGSCKPFKTTVVFPIKTFEILKSTVMYKLLKTKNE